MILWQNLTIVVTLLNLSLAGIIIFLERRNIGVTWAWLMVLLFLPGVGFFLYLVLGQNLSRRKLYKINQKNEDTLSRIIEAQRSSFRSKATVFNDPAVHNYRDLIYMNLSSSSSVYTQNNHVEIFTDGRAKFDALFEKIAEAKDHIHLMYFIVRDDDLGHRLIELLASKAKEGVEVRFLYDDIGCSSLPTSFFRPLVQAGGRVAAFFPSRIPYMNIRVNYRNHRKLVVIDGTYGFIGGLNVGDEYLGLKSRFGFWRDTHLLIHGHAVLQMQGHFLLDWNLASLYKVDLENSDKLFRLDENQLGHVGMQIVSSGPNDPIEHIRNAYIKMIYSAKESIYIQTPYFIPDESLLSALKMAALSGVDVRLMLPARPDHKMVYWASFSYLGDLLSLGMKCYLYEKGFLHAKMIVVDGKVASVGTANVDIRSFKLNFEINAVIYDTQTVDKLTQVFHEDMSHCRELTHRVYEGRPRMHKVRESCMRLLSPIL